MYQEKAGIKAVTENRSQKVIWNIVWDLQQFISWLNMNKVNLLLGFQGKCQIPGVRWINIFWRKIGWSRETNVRQFLWENDWLFRLTTHSTHDGWIIGKTFSFRICGNHKTKLFKKGFMIRRSYKCCLAVNQLAKLQMFSFY